MRIDFQKSKLTIFKLNSSNTFPVLGAILGGRYYFHKPYGVFAEVGYGVGIGYASIGFCYHLIR